VGNDLSTPRPEFDFAGLKPGDRWCLCAPRWKEALDAGVAPLVVLAATHEEMLAISPLGVLKDHAVRSEQVAALQPVDRSAARAPARIEPERLGAERRDPQQVVSARPGATRNGSASLR